MLHLTRPVISLYYNNIMTIVHWGLCYFCAGPFVTITVPTFFLSKNEAVGILTVPLFPRTLWDQLRLLRTNCGFMSLISFALIQSKLAFTILHLLSPHTVQCRPELDHQWCRLRHRSSHRRRLFLRPKHP